MRDHVWWKQLHWFEYGAELLGTAFLVFAGVSAVVFDFGTGSPLAHVLPDTSLRRLITGLLFAGSGALVAISPLGKLSDGQINPVVSLAFWVAPPLGALLAAGSNVQVRRRLILNLANLLNIMSSRASAIFNDLKLHQDAWPDGAIALSRDGGKVKEDIIA